MLLLVPLAGEPKIQPFDGALDNFRVSFGSPVFLCFLLWNRGAPFAVYGFCAGLAVIVFRIGLDVLWGSADLVASALLRGPTFFYYLTYAVCFHIPQGRFSSEKALRVAFWSIFAELCASLVELFAAAQMQGFSLLITPQIIAKLLLIAAFRNFFILSFFFLMQLSRSEARAEAQRRQKEELLLLISNLYEEAVHLQKSQKNAEAVMRDCYGLYESVQSGAPLEAQRLAAALLDVAGQVHEIKKDSQRVCAGLRQLMKGRRFGDFMAAAELFAVVVRSNERYARDLGKDIVFVSSVDRSLPPLHAYTVLSLVNNLIANAVEAVQKSGEIRLCVCRSGEDVEIRVCDNGNGIPPSRLPRLFKVGYTTKFDAEGNQSGGIGLPYVKHLAEELGGRIVVEKMRQGETTFLLSLPLKSLKG